MCVSRSLPRPNACMQVISLIPPTEANLARYARWACTGPREAGCFLAAACDGTVRLEVAPDHSAVLPAGWPYALAAPLDTACCMGQFLHPYALGAALGAWEVEELMRLKQRGRFPLFKHVMWHAAWHYMRLLRAAAGAAARLRPEGKGGPRPQLCPAAAVHRGKWRKHASASGDALPLHNAKLRSLG